MRNKIKGIIFDLDGTLIDSLPLHVKSFIEIMKEQGITVQRREIEKMMGLPTSEIFRILQKKYGLKGRIKDLREERRRRYFRALGRRNIVFPGVIKKLKELKSRYKLALATGSSRLVFSRSALKNFMNYLIQLLRWMRLREGNHGPMN